MTQVITRWEPENPDFWKKQGQHVARRNLWISIPCLMLGFVISVVWSMVILNLPNAGFQFSKDQLFLLAALPHLSGATLRILYTFMPARFGGRKWTAFSTAALLIPALWLGFAVQNSATTYPTMLLISLLCGLGSGNFASSMANIAYFFPSAQKGAANGLNAGLGNLGVPLAQLLIPFVITLPLFGAIGGDAQSLANGSILQGQVWLQNAGFVWVPVILMATVAAWFGMNDLADAKSSFVEQSIIFKRKDNWIMCYLYIGTFGSFIGFAGAFALLTKSLFPSVPIAQYAFLGPLIGALIRPVGGMVSDRIGGAKVTFGIFIGMIVGVLGVLSALPVQQSAGNWAVFFWSFLLLFTCAGLGNGSTYKMIPTIFVTQSLRRVKRGNDAAVQKARLTGVKESAAAAGFISAIGAYGGYFIPQGFGLSMKATGGPEMALYVFLSFYVSCMAITWWRYGRRNAAMPC